MTIELNSFAVNDTDYIEKHNENYKDIIEPAINLLQSDTNAIKSSTSNQATTDYRLLAKNLLINGSFDYFQRGNNEVPDAWIKQNFSLNYTAKKTTIKKINTFSCIVTGIGDLTQKLLSEYVLNLDSENPISLGCWVKTSISDNAQIVIYDGIVEERSNFHTGSGEFEFLKINRVQGNGQTPTEIKIILRTKKDSQAIFNGVTAIKGNPTLGPISVINDPVLEKYRVFSLYEKGKTTISGVGILKNSNRQIRKTIKFCSIKRELPNVFIDSEIETGYDLDIENITKCGFDFVATDLGGISGLNGFEIENIQWTSEVI